MKSHELFAELASDNRLAILKALEKESLKFTSITKIIGATSPEASRQLNRLSGKELIAKDGEGYYSLTNLGRLVVSSLSNLETIANRSDFFLKHDTSPIPPHLLRELDSFAGTEYIEGVFVLVNKMTAIFDDIHVYGWYLSDDFPRFYLPHIEKKLKEGVEFRAVYPQTLIDNLKKDLPEQMYSDIEIRTLDEVRIIVNVTDRFGLLALPGPDGNVDRDHVLIGPDEKFIKWCRAAFLHYFEMSKRC
ncbi:helix-turn-helix transcriptional regulator [Methanolobus bombayensis]|uniref:helix-turn-helix transcriptional regulator n=1 Tax=Methanolobus bombayensis TaxID=38023 RepID=UPI001AEAA0BE|nr:transcriptional regulator FilR1 domain-containing protein [Methanolobus bombayensis]MBP1908769.1 putative transcriptional regulator [Methanolobus bombayensis]